MRTRALLKSKGWATRKRRRELLEELGALRPTNNELRRWMA